MKAEKMLEFWGKQSVDSFLKRLLLRDTMALICYHVKLATPLTVLTVPDSIAIRT